MSQYRADYTLTEYQFTKMADSLRRLSIKEYDGSYTPFCYDRLQSALNARDIEGTEALPLAVVKSVPNRGPSRYWVVAATDLEKQLAQISAGEPA